MGNPDPAPSIQPYDLEFRWSASEPKPLTVQFDTTFVDFFGTAGVEVISEALASWDNGVANAGRDTTNPLPPATKYDLESVGVHELGHALGLTHPDIASMNNRNWQNTAMGLFPHLNPINVATGGSEVMHSTIGRGVARRDLTDDDVAGLNYLYDGANLNQPVAPEPQVPNPNPPPPAFVPIAGAGIGGLQLLGDIGLDTNNPNPMVINEAIPGSMQGDNIDIFAVDFTTFIIPMPPTSSGETDEMEIFQGTDGVTLAITVVRFKYNFGTDGPGIIQGVDIYFNAGIGIDDWHVTPEPNVLAILVFGSLVLLPHWRRRVAG